MHAWVPGNVSTNFILKQVVILVLKWNIRYFHHFSPLISFVILKEKKQTNQDLSYHQMFEKIYISRPISRFWLKNSVTYNFKKGNIDTKYLTSLLFFSLCASPQKQCNFQKLVHGSHSWKKTLSFECGITNGIHALGKINWNQTIILNGLVMANNI